MSPRIGKGVSKLNAVPVGLKFLRLMLERVDPAARPPLRPPIPPSLRA